MRKGARNAGRREFQRCDRLSVIEKRTKSARCTVCIFTEILEAAKSSTLQISHTNLTFASGARAERSKPALIPLGSFLYDENRYELSSRRSMRIRMAWSSSQLRDRAICIRAGCFHRVSFFPSYLQPSFLCRDDDDSLQGVCEFSVTD